MREKNTSLWLGVSIGLNIVLVVAFLYFIFGNAKEQQAPTLTETTTSTSLYEKIGSFDGTKYIDPVAIQAAEDRAGNYRNDPKYGGALHSLGEWFAPKSIADYLRDRLPVIEGRLGYPAGSTLPTNCVWVIGHYYCVTRNNNSDSLKLMIIPSLYDTIKNVLHDVISKDAVYSTLAAPKPGGARPLTAPVDSIAYDAGHLWPPN